VGKGNTLFARFLFVGHTLKVLAGAYSLYQPRSTTARLAEDGQYLKGKTMINANEEFEIVGELYHSRFRMLRPGKSVPMQCGYESSSEENQAQFSAWRMSPLAFQDAIECISRLQAEIEELKGTIDSLPDAEAYKHLEAEIGKLSIAMGSPALHWSKGSIQAAVVSEAIRRLTPKT
jgi:hypothetical protein